MAYTRETGETRTHFYYGMGCKSCANTGYKGRTGIFEMLALSDELRASLLKGTTSNRLRVDAIKQGMVTMMRDGMLKVKADVTTPTEVLRNAFSIDD